MILLTLFRAYNLKHRIDLFNKIIYKILISNELLICKTTKSLKKNNQKINLFYLISYVLVQKYYFSCPTNDINLSHCKESFFKWRLKVQHCPKKYSMNRKEDPESRAT